jgi:valyl-tRNA synthetase
MGQDLNLAMDRVLSSRNFANKLWNAGKFILSNLGGSKSADSSNGSSGGSAEWRSLAQADFSGPDSLQGLPLTERWILSSLHQASLDRRHPPWQTSFHATTTSIFCLQLSYLIASSQAAIC